MTAVYYSKAGIGMQVLSRGNVVLDVLVMLHFFAFQGLSAMSDQATLLGKSIPL